LEAGAGASMMKPAEPAALVDVVPRLFEMPTQPHTPE
jgi:hypothetical protein